MMDGNIPNVNGYEKFLAELGESLSPALEVELRKALSNVNHIRKELRRGPKKTNARCWAKKYEYKKDHDKAPNAEYWQHFNELVSKNNISSFRKFCFRILDYVRVSALFATAEDLVRGVTAVMEHFKVVGMKNGFRKDAFVSSSGYRDLKLLVEIKSTKPIQVDLPFTLGYEQPNMPKGTRMIAEIQFVLEKWMDCKKTTSTSYKIRRAQNW